MFFMLSSSGPDSNAESNLKTALSRLSKERDEFEGWLYPGRARNGTWENRSNHTLVTMPTDRPDNDTNSNGTSGEHNGDVQDSFVMQDLTPPATLKDKVNLLLYGSSEDALYYRNISGFFKGSWAAHPNIDATDGQYNLTEAANKQGQFPWTGSSKKSKKSEGNVVRLNVREAIPHVPGMDTEAEKKNANIAIIRGSLEIQLHDMVDEKGSNDGESKAVDLDIEGVQCVFHAHFRCTCIS